MSAVAPINLDAYSKLLKKTAPQVIRTEQQNDAYIAELERLTAREKFENEHYDLSPASPVDVLTELMESRGLKQKDLVDVFGTASVVSEVLRGKRRITINQIKRLSKRFNVPPQVFF
jgi:HTH-type transcriptional regulator / antitoxin HigA